MVVGGKVCHFMHLRIRNRLQDFIGQRGIASQVIARDTGLNWRGECRPYVRSWHTRRC